MKTLGPARQGPLEITLHNLRDMMETCNVREAPCGTPVTATCALSGEAFVPCLLDTRCTATQGEQNLLAQETAGLQLQAPLPTDKDCQRVLRTGVGKLLPTGLEGPPQSPQYKLCDTQESLAE